MGQQIALLRAVNVGGTGKIAMDDLRTCMEAIGFPAANTILQSGNVVFESREVGGADLEGILERAFKKQFKLDCAVVVRSADEWSEIISQNPMESKASVDPSHLLLLLGKDPVTAEGIRALQGVIEDKGGRESVRACDGAGYIFFADGIGTSRVTTKLIERAVGVAVTARNWNTVLKIGDALK